MTPEADKIVDEWLAERASKKVSPNDEVTYITNLGDIADLKRRVSEKMGGWVSVVKAELEKATSKHPTWPTDPIHAFAVLNEEVGELDQAIVEHTYEPEKSSREDVAREARHTAAMAIRFLMSLNKYEYRGSVQHVQLPPPPTESN